MEWLYSHHKKALLGKKILISEKSLSLFDIQREISQPTASENPFTFHQLVEVWNGSILNKKSTSGKKLLISGNPILSFDIQRKISPYRFRKSSHYYQLREAWSSSIPQQKHIQVPPTNLRSVERACHNRLCNKFLDFQVIREPANKLSSTLKTSFLSIIYGGALF